MCKITAFAELPPQTAVSIDPPIFAFDDLNRVVMPHRPTSTGKALNRVLENALASDGMSGVEIDESITAPTELIAHPFETEKLDFVILEEPRLILSALRRHRDVRHGELMNKPVGRFVEIETEDEPKYQIVLSPTGRPVTEADVVHQMIDELSSMMAKVPLQSK